MKKVLIVDDTPRGLLGLREVLTQPYINVFEATSGRQALEVHRRENVDLIIMDLNMPGMDGEQVTRTIRSDPALRHVSILMYCDQVRPGTRERCMACGANDFLQRPFRSVELTMRVGQLLDVAVRRNTKLLAHVEINQGGGVERFVARILNVSTSGMLLETDTPLELGRDLMLKFFVPGSHTQLQAAARVVRRAESQGTGRWGVRFTKIDEGTRRMLKGYVGAPRHR